MAYIDRSYLITQFRNFANKINSTFAKKTDLDEYAKKTDVPTGAVRYDAAQALTEDQKAQARQNIGAGDGTGSGDVSQKAGITPVVGNIVTWDGSKVITDSGFTLGVSVPADAKFTDTTYDVATTSADGLMSKEDKGKLDAVSNPMMFKGSLGTGGTITDLPAASAENTGYTYKVITDGTYASQAAKVGDTFISDGTAWILIPSGDEPSGTVISVGVENDGDGISIEGSPITSSGTIKVKNTGVISTTIDADGTIKVNTGGVSADLIAVETSNFTYTNCFDDTKDLDKWVM